MTITTHVCQSNFRSTWISSQQLSSRWRRPCWPAPITTAIPSNTNPERAGGFEPLRFLPKGDNRGWSASSLRRAANSEKNFRHRRQLRERECTLDQLALSPQCGFASTEEGNVLTEEKQWAKLKLAVDVAGEVRGK